jgi:hypothetical protein
MGGAPIINLMFGLSDLRWRKQFSKFLRRRGAFLHRVIG